MDLTEEKRLQRNAYMRAWKRENKDSVNRVNKNWKDANRELVRERSRAYAAKAYRNDPEKHLSRSREYRAENREMVNKRTKEWFKNHPEYVREYRLRRLEAHLIKAAKGRAKAKGIPFTITEKDIEVPTMCPALNIPLDRTARKGVFNSLTLDRIVPERGYVPGNVRVISCRANRIKSDASLAELELLAAYVRREAT